MKSPAKSCNDRGGSHSAGSAGSDMGITKYVITASVAVIVATTMSATGGSLPTPAHAAEPRRLKVAIPAYIFSDDLRGWEAIIGRPGQVSVVVLNPRNGPNVRAGTRCDGYTPPDDPGTGPDLTGLRFDETFVSVLFPDDPPLITSSPNYLGTLEAQFVRRANALSAAGMSAYGYVWSNTNGADPTCPRSAPIIEAEIALYRTRYGIRDIFFDDASAACPSPLRRSMADAAHETGARVIMNVGAIAGACLADEAEVVVNFEGSPASYLGAREALDANAELLRQRNSAARVWHIVYGADDSTITPVIDQARRSADLLYLGDDRPQAHGCDLGTSTFDSLYGMWPRVRADTGACAGRFNGSTLSWDSVVDAISASIRFAAPSAGSVVSPRRAAPSAPPAGSTPRRAAPPSR